MSSTKRPGQPIDHEVRRKLVKMMRTFKRYGYSPNDDSPVYDSPVFDRNGGYMSEESPMYDAETEEDPGPPPLVDEHAASDDEADDEAKLGYARQNVGGWSKHCFEKEVQLDKDLEEVRTLPCSSDASCVYIFACARQSTG